MKHLLSRLVALLSAIACIALVGTIEVLNIQAGDAIGRKRMQEPHSKWRITWPRTVRIMTEREYRHERGIPTEQAMAPSELKEVEKLFQERWQKLLPGHRLDLAMRNFSIWGVPLGALACIFGWLARRGVCEQAGRPFFSASCGIGALTLLISAFRYLPALGL